MTRCEPVFIIVVAAGACECQGNTQRQETKNSMARKPINQQAKQLLWGTKPN